MLCAAVVARYEEARIQGNVLNTTISEIPLLTATALCRVHKHMDGTSGRPLTSSHAHNTVIASYIV